MCVSLCVVHIGFICPWRSDVEPLGQEGGTGSEWGESQYQKVLALLPSTLVIF